MAEGLAVFEASGTAVTARTGKDVGARLGTHVAESIVRVLRMGDL